MASLASYDHDALDARYKLPKASELGPNAIVLGLSGTDRTTYRWGFVMWSGALLLGGIAFGYYLGSKR